MRRGLLVVLTSLVGLAWAGVLAGAASATTSPRLAVRSAALIEESTGRQLLGINAGAEVPIASATKIMTALVVLEHARMGQVFAAPPFYFNAYASVLGLAAGERMTVHDLLLAALLPSDDDAALDLAYNVGGGSVARFVAMMNARAQQLGLAHTHYSTPVGLDTPGNYSTASDLVRLASYVLTREPWFRHAVSLKGAALHSGPVRYVLSRDTLLSMPWVNGVKTGHTLQAGYVLVSSGTQRGMTLISAVLGTDSPAARDANALAALDYGFANFQLATPVRAGAVIARPGVSGVSGVRATVVAAAAVAGVVPIGARVALRVSWSRARPLVGPLRRGAVVGSLVAVAGGSVVGRVPLRLAATVPAPSSSPAGAIGVLLLLIVAACGGGWMLVQRRRRELVERRRERIRVRDRRARALAADMDALTDGEPAEVGQR